MTKFIQIKSPDEWATTKQACRDELVVYLFSSYHTIYTALLLCIEHSTTEPSPTHYIYIYIYIHVCHLTFASENLDVAMNSQSG